MQETERIEFKERLTDDIYKEIIAFANTDGGTIYVGINDHGEPVGLEDVDDVYTRITNGVRDAILPMSRFLSSILWKMEKSLKWRSERVLISLTI